MPVGDRAAALQSLDTAVKLQNAGLRLFKVSTGRSIPFAASRRFQRLERQLKFPHLTDWAGIHALRRVRAVARRLFTARIAVWPSHRSGLPPLGQRLSKRVVGSTRQLMRFKQAVRSLGHS